MDERNAERVAILLEEAISNIGQALHTTMESWSQVEYEEFRSRSAEVVADISVHLLDPIYRRFPELEPELVREKANLWCHVERGE